MLPAGREIRLEAIVSTPILLIEGPVDEIPAENGIDLTGGKNGALRILVVVHHGLEFTIESF